MEQPQGARQRRTPWGFLRAGGLKRDRRPVGPLGGCDQPGTLPRTKLPSPSIGVPLPDLKRNSRFNGRISHNNRAWHPSCRFHGPHGTLARPRGLDCFRQGAQRSSCALSEGRRRHSRLLVLLCVCKLLWRKPWCYWEIFIGDLQWRLGLR